jgi:hypothetical protein
LNAPIFEANSPPLQHKEDCGIILTPYGIFSVIEVLYVVFCGIFSFSEQVIIKSSGTTSEGSLGIIGTGNHGANEMNAFLRDGRLSVLAVCDAGRGLLARDDTTTPDHWHAPLPIVCTGLRNDSCCRRPLSPV